MTSPEEESTPSHIFHRIDVGISFNVSGRAREGEDGDEEDGDCPWLPSAMKGDPGPQKGLDHQAGEKEKGVGINKEGGEEPCSQFVL